MSILFLYLYFLYFKNTEITKIKYNRVLGNEQKIQQRISEAEMRVLRWMSPFTKEDGLQDNKWLRRKIVVASIMDKIRENVLGWINYVYGHEYV